MREPGDRCPMGPPMTPEEQDRHWEHRYIPGLIDDIIADRSMSYEDTVRLIEGLVRELGNRMMMRKVDATKIVTLTGIIAKLTEARDYFVAITRGR